MTRWIQKVTKDKGKESTVQYETPKMKDQKLFQKSIEDLLVVPAESIGFLLKNGKLDLRQSRFEDGWPGRLKWWPIYHKRSSGERINYVKLNNTVVRIATRILQIDGLQGSKGQRSKRQSKASEKTSDEEGGGVKGESRI